MNLPDKMKVIAKPGVPKVDSRFRGNDILVIGLAQIVMCPS